MKISYLGHRWSIEGVSPLGAQYLRLIRPASVSELKRNGSCVTAVDCHIDNLKTKTRGGKRP
jgi:hypothetical protein